MVVVPAREVSCPLAIGKGPDELRGALVLRRWIPRLVQKDTIHRLPHKFRDGNTLSPCDRPQPTGLVGGELHLHGALFGPQRDLAVFDAVTLDQEVGTLTWPNGADFDPATLHEWPRVWAELAARAQAWAEPNYAQRANTRMEPTRR